MKVTVRNTIVSIFFVGSFLFLGFALNRIYQIHTISAKGVMVPGVVAEMQRKSDTDKNWIDYRVEYFDESGNRCQLHSYYATNFTSVKIGDTLSIIYRKDNPEKAFINTSDERNKPVIFSLLAASICLIIGVFIFFKFK